MTDALIDSAAADVYCVVAAGGGLEAILRALLAILGTDRAAVMSTRARCDEIQRAEPTDLIWSEAVNKITLALQTDAFRPEPR